MSVAQRARTCDVLAELRAFDGFGARTRLSSDDGIPYYVNEFWTAAQRRAHSLHEISYRACFKPQLPEFFINRLTLPGDVVHDPFMGRGTTPLQATLQGRRACGSDVSPLSVMLTRPRLVPPTLAQIADRLAQMSLSNVEAKVDRDDLLVFYHPDTLRQICALRAWLMGREHDFDVVDDWIRMVALNRLTGHSPGFFSVYSLPPNQAVTIKAQARINTRRAQTPPPRDVAALIMRKSRALLADTFPAPRDDARLFVADAAAAKGLETASVDLVVTSPPFLDTVDYHADNWLRNWFAGIDPQSVAISNLRDLVSWTRKMRTVLAGLARVIRPGGYLAFEVGEVRGGGVLLEREIWAALDGLPFERLCVLVNSQRFTKTSNCWGVANNVAGINSNRVVIAIRS